MLATDYSTANKPPHGGGSVIIPTYGLDDDAFAKLRARWADWWRQNYPEAMKNECAEEMA